MNIPNATPEEVQRIRVVVSEWDMLTPEKQAVVLAMERGHDTLDAAAAYLGVTPEEVWHRLPIWGVLYDRTTNKLWFK